MASLRGKNHVELSGDSIVSMNLWGFTQSTIAHMRSQFSNFLEYQSLEHIARISLSTAVNGQIPKLVRFYASTSYKG
ncbi:MAG: hypothetical protein Ct9H300mP15_21460 [Gemmatimonadota bacterium]|nr:MAG: hypothetical protein Ct9H300mP15_21460 [Gemmatimonadota bacterium]